MSMRLLTCTHWNLCSRAAHLMPPQSPLASRTLIQSASAIETFVCPSCALRKNLVLRQWIRSRRFTQRSQNGTPRHTSTLASSTAINARPEIRPDFLELYNSLQAIRTRAAIHVNLSRVQLALRSLEARDAVIRVAVLGLNGRSVASRRLVRTLLADPLEQEAAWEKQLELEQDASEGRGLLLRYGETPEVISQNALLSTVSVPAPLLRIHNLEILLTRLSTAASSAKLHGSPIGQMDAILVPSLQTPASENGRFSVVTYPVHKTLVYGEGVADSLDFGRYIASEPRIETSEDMVRVAFGMPLPGKAVQESSGPFTVDVSLASSAIARLRQSTGNSTTYEEEWFRSGMPRLADWITQNSSGNGKRLKPAVRNLIESLLDDTSENISNKEQKRSRELVSKSISQEARNSLLDWLSKWAEGAHVELRDQLDIAFRGKRWNRVAWWKLFWRVDDVEMAASEIIERRWLIEAEKGIIWLAGRIEEAGARQIRDPLAHIAAVSAAPKSTEGTRRFGSEPPVPTLSDLVERPLDDDEAPLLPSPRPWPIQIAVVRSHLAASTIPRLHARAQTLVLETLSTMSLTSALSVLLYVGSASTGLYEAGAVASLGLLWSMRRLQNKWESAHGTWEAEVREEGRRALKDTEDVVAGVVRGQNGASVDVEGAEERNRARKLVKRARDALHRVE